MWLCCEAASVQDEPWHSCWHVNGQLTRLSKANVLACKQSCAVWQRRVHSMARCLIRPLCDVLIGIDADVCSVLEVGFSVYRTRC